MRQKQGAAEMADFNAGFWLGAFLGFFFMALFGGWYMWAEASWAYQRMAIDRGPQDQSAD